MNEYLCAQLHSLLFCVTVPVSVYIWAFVCVYLTLRCVSLCTCVRRSLAMSV